MEHLEQMNMFETNKPIYKIKKPIRLIELFAGIGSQAMALKTLMVDFVHWKVIEHDKYAIASYNAIHDTNFSVSDIREISAVDLAIDHTDLYDYIMTYSFPCQDLSKAGKKMVWQKIAEREVVCFGLLKGCYLNVLNCLKSYSWKMCQMC